jgi:putative transposase
MTRANRSTIRDVLTSIISTQLIRRRAKKLNAVKRERRVDIAALVYTLVLGFERGAKRTLASFRRAYAIATGTTLAPSAFYDRFTPELAELMRQLVPVAFERLAAEAKLQGALASFARVAIADGSGVFLGVGTTLLLMAPSVTYSRRASLACGSMGADIGLSCADTF